MRLNILYHLLVRVNKTGRINQSRLLFIRWHCEAITLFNNSLHLWIRLKTKDNRSWRPRKNSSPYTVTRRILWGIPQCVNRICYGVWSSVKLISVSLGKTADLKRVNIFFILSDEINRNCNTHRMKILQRSDFILSHWYC